MGQLEVVRDPVDDRARPLGHGHQGELDQRREREGELREVHRRDRARVHDHEQHHGHRQRDQGEVGRVAGRAGGREDERGQPHVHDLQPVRDEPHVRDPLQGHARDPHDHDARVDPRAQLLREDRLHEHGHDRVPAGERVDEAQDPDASAPRKWQGVVPLHLRQRLPADVRPPGRHRDPVQVLPRDREDGHGHGDDPVPGDDEEGGHGHDLALVPQMN